MTRRAIFFDRDDTLVRTTGVASGGDLGDPALVELLPGAAEAVGRAHRAGYFVAVVTNQGGVARGRYSVEDVGRVHARLSQLLGGLVDDYRFCPFHPKGAVPAFTKEHPWRKPAPGMLLDLAQAHRLDLAASWMVGDAVRDCQAGRAAGCTTVHLAPEDNADSDTDSSDAIDFVCPDVLAATELILSNGA